MNRKLRIIAERIEDMPRINIRYFVPDDKRGRPIRYSRWQGKKLDEFEKVLIMADERKYPLKILLKLKGVYFKAGYFCQY